MTNNLKRAINLNQIYSTLQSGKDNALFVQKDTKEKSRLIQSFFQKNLDLLESQNKAERKAAKNFFEQYKECVQIKYRRKSLWQKLWRLKKNPYFVLQKSENEIFDRLSASRPDIQQKYQSFIDDFIDMICQKIKMLKQQQRKNAFKVLPSVLDQNGAIKPKRLALVHTSRYKPLQKNGAFCIQTTSTATNFEYPRNTVHFSINHHVHSHLAGAWNDCPFVVIAPFVPTMQKNGLPAGISSVDTFFELGAGQDLILPDQTHFIMPAENRNLQGHLFATAGHRTLYKTDHFTDAEKAFISSDPTLSDQEYAGLLKLKLTSMMIEKLGYATQAEQEQFADVNNYEKDSFAKKVANLGESLGVKSSADAALHASQFLGENGFGAVVNTVYDTVKSMEILLMGADNAPIKVKKQLGKDTIIIGQKSQEKSFDKSDFEYYCKNLHQMHRLQDYLTQQGEEKMLQTKANPKTIECYNLWKSKMQQKIGRIYPKSNQFDFDRFVESVKSKQWNVTLKTSQKDF